MTLAETARQIAAQRLGPIVHEECVGMSAKQKLRAELEAQTQAFIRAGGKIKQTNDLQTFPWPASKDAKQLVTVANFAYQNSLTQFEVLGAARRGELTIWIRRGDKCLLRSKAVAWHKARCLATSDKPGGVR